MELTETEIHLANFINKWVDDNVGWSEERKLTHGKGYLLAQAIVKECFGEAGENIYDLRHDNANLRQVIDTLENKLKEEHISVPHYARCSKHVDVPQLNSNEFSGSECGACVQEDMKKKDDNGLPLHLRQDMEATRGMIARQMGKIDKLTQETFAYKKLLRWVAENVPSEFWRENKYRGQVLSEINEKTSKA